MVGNKERSPLLPTIGLFSLSANAKELEPAKRSQIDLAQTNSTIVHVFWKLPDRRYQPGKAYLPPVS